LPRRLRRWRRQQRKQRTTASSRQCGALPDRCYGPGGCYNKFHGHGQQRLDEQRSQVVSVMRHGAVRHRVARNDAERSVNDVLGSTHTTSK